MIKLTFWSCQSVPRSAILTASQQHQSSGREGDRSMGLFLEATMESELRTKLKGFKWSSPWTDGGCVRDLILTDRPGSFIQKLSRTKKQMGKKSGQFLIFPRCLRENLYEELDDRVLNDLEVPITCILLTTLQGGRVMTL